MSKSNNTHRAETSSTNLPSYLYTNNFFYKESKPSHQHLSDFYKSLIISKVTDVITIFEHSLGNRWCIIRAECSVTFSIGKLHSDWAQKTWTVDFNYRSNAKHLYCPPLRWLLSCPPLGHFSLIFLNSVQGLHHTTPFLISLLTLGEQHEILTLLRWNLFLRWFEHILHIAQYLMLFLIHQ